MKFRKLFIGAAALGLLAVPVVTAQAEPVPVTPDSTGTMTTEPGGPHVWDVEYFCDGTFTFENTTSSGTGNFDSAAGTFDFAEASNDWSYAGTFDPADTTDPVEWLTATWTDHPDETTGSGLPGNFTGMPTEADCAPEGPWTIEITVDAGGGHDLIGEIDPCSGAFTAEGVYEYAEDGTESAEGTLIDSDLDFTSDYNGGYAGSPYSYTVDAVVTGTDWVGNYTYSDGGAGGSGSGLTGTVVVTEGAPVNCAQLACDAMNSSTATATYDETDDSCTVVTVTGNHRTGSRTSYTPSKFTGKGKSQVLNWTETFGTVDDTSTQNYTWDGDSYNADGAPTPGTAPSTNTVTVTCTQTSKKAAPTPSYCGSNPGPASWA